MVVTYTTKGKKSNICDSVIAFHIPDVNLRKAVEKFNYLILLHLYINKLLKQNIKTIIPIT